MGSLDVESLFTDRPLEETIEIWTSEPFRESETVEGLSKSEIKVSEYHKKRIFSKQLFAGSQCCYSTIMKRKLVFLTKILFLNEI